MNECGECVRNFAAEGSSRWSEPFQFVRGDLWGSEMIRSARAHTMIQMPLSIHRSLLLPLAYTSRSAWKDVLTVLAFRQISLARAQSTLTWDKNQNKSSCVLELWHMSSAMNKPHSHDLYEHRLTSMLNTAQGFLITSKNPGISHIVFTHKLVALSGFLAWVSGPRRANFCRDSLLRLYGIDQKQTSPLWPVPGPQLDAARLMSWAQHKHRCGHSSGTREPNATPSPEPLACQTGSVFQADSGGPQRCCLNSRMPASSESYTALIRFLP